MSITNEISLALQKGKRAQVQELVKKALEEGVTAKEILNEGLIAGMSEVGEKFKNNEVYVPEVLIAARAMNAGTAIVKPYLAAEGVEPVGKAVVCTVKGDLHDIGKNLVKMMFEGVGIECIDLGVDVEADKIIEAVKENGAKVIGLSSLLTTTMVYHAEVIKALEAAGIRDQVKVMVGGAPVTQEFADEIGADAYTSDAASAAEVALSFFKA
ncbi:MAG: cobalamin-binding protein [Ruminococcaceae bacterium]|nr:cobalamin-binding protein [Oscillospiraceae bacterium]